MYFLALLVLICHLEESVICFSKICIQLKLSNVETVYYNRNSYAYCSAIIFLDLDLSVVCHLLHWRLGTCTYFLVVAPLSQCQRQARPEIWMRLIGLSTPICFKLHFSLNSTVPDAPTCTGTTLAFTTLTFGTSLVTTPSYLILPSPHNLLELLSVLWQLFSLLSTITTSCLLAWISLSVRSFLNKACVAIILKTTRTLANVICLILTVVIVLRISSASLKK